MSINCQVCGIKSTKYKCPTCRISYCSVDCWKHHKTTSCQQLVVKQEKIDSANTESQTVQLYETRDTVPLHKLKQLEGSKALQDVLHNPHVRDMLIAIDNSPNPAGDMQAAMLEPIFIEFANECLKVVEPFSKSVNEGVS